MLTPAGPPADDLPAMNADAKRPSDPALAPDPALALASAPVSALEAQREGEGSAEGAGGERAASASDRTGRADAANRANRTRQAGQTSQSSQTRRGKQPKPAPVASSGHSADPANPADKPSIQLPGLIDPHDLSADRQFSMNLARGLQVLRAFTAGEPVLGNREIADRTRLPKATVSRITYTLTLMGYLARDASQKRYCLGPGVLSLGHPLLASMPVRQVAGPLLQALARQTGCSVNLAMRDRDQVVYVSAVRADASNPHLPDIGTTRPLLATAIGRALIVGAQPDEQAAILNRLRLLSPQQVALQQATLDADRLRFEREGFCLSQAAAFMGIHAIAMPLARRAGEPLLAVNCTLSAERNTDDLLLRHALPLLRHMVKQFEVAQLLR